MATLRPLADRIVIKPISKELKTKSGILLPESSQEKSNEAEVVAVGPGKYVDGKLVAPEVKAGDTVLYKESWGRKVKLDDVEYEVVDADDILAVLDK